MSDKNIKYWNNFYSNSGAVLCPSQFAAHILNEFSSTKKIIDIGYGNGRDSLFFASHGLNVLGIDGSLSAISNCQRIAQHMSLDNVNFQELDFDNALSHNEFIKNIESEWTDALIYSRFFLHAIDENAEVNLLKFVSNLLSSNGYFCLEFRTIKDQYQQKETPSHYRRYINIQDFISLSIEMSFKVEYMIEGFGFAKFKSDDAHVARIVLKKI